MKVLISGASGLVGKSLVQRLQNDRHEITALVRDQSKAGVFWNPSRGELNSKDLEGFDGVIHLAGESIADARWTEAKKESIYRSRIDGTRLLSENILKTKQQPKVFISASAIGFYEGHPTKELDESAPSGNNFLSKVCLDWEMETNRLSDHGIRVVNSRIGIVLSPEGGALSKMILPFKMGLGGKLGDGQQYMPWIDLEDVVEAFAFCLKNESLRGPVNFTAPNPVTQEEFAHELATYFNRPSLMRTPEFILKAVAGEMAEQLLLSSFRVIPKKLIETGFKFKFSNLKELLANQLSR